MTGTVTSHWRRPIKNQQPALRLCKHTDWRAATAIEDTVQVR